MNHLAHFQLATGCDSLLVGALLGDHLKGPLDDTLPPGLVRGVRLHRRIDAMTDADEDLRRLRSRFQGPERRLAGIVLDVFFDHMLTRHWDRFAVMPLAEFAHEVCDVLERWRDWLSPGALRQQRRIVEHRLLERYGDPSVIDGTLMHIGAQLGRTVEMEAAIRQAWSDLDALDAAFLQLYPRLQRTAALPEFRTRVSAG